MLDKTTNTLFSRYPREVGNPFRKPVYNPRETEHFIQQNQNSTDQIFISLYPSNFIIGKLFFDADYGDSVLEDFVSLFQHTLKHHLNPVPLITGLKGSRPDPRYHLYVRTTPKIYGPEAKVLVYKAQMKLLTDVFGPLEKVLVDRREKFKLSNNRYIAFDPTAVGDIKRLVRIPNTPRISKPKTFCTYLPYDFPSFTPKELIEHCKSIHTYDYPMDDSKIFLTDPQFDFPFEEKPRTKNEDHLSTATVKNAKDVKPLLRPCVYNSINHIHPSYTMRQIATIDLYDIGLNEDQITQIFSELGWEDYDEKVTRDKVNYYCEGYRKGHKPYSCSKLREMGIPSVGCCRG